MELHHHSHSLSPEARKKWTHYLWEFLMLFLAVFCGFLAENIREHKVERQREIQFIKSLAEDLKDDEKKLEQDIRAEQIGIRRLDTLFLLLDSPLLAKKNGDLLYYLARLAPRENLFASNDRTFDQLKNSGGFRLIPNETSNRIMSYYTQFPLLRLLEENYNNEFDHFKTAASRIIDPRVFHNQEDEQGVIRPGNDNPHLLSYDPGLLKEAGLFIVYLNGTRHGKITLMEKMKKDSRELIKYLQERYGLE